MSDQDTIVAVATALGESAIAVIRVSGPNAFAVVRQLTDLPEPVPSHRALLRTLSDDGKILDHALVLPFVGPRSFTGEDVVELHTHGGLVTVRGVLDALRAAGARSALAGEFSRRALLNDKLDLVQAEAIADVIHARSNAAHRIAQDHLAGELSKRIEALKEGVAAALLLVEAAIDFAAEEHVYTIGAAEVSAKLGGPLADINSLLLTYDEGRMRSHGVRVAIVGPPNAGKSSLLNVLLGTERAIVTDIAGTTRDYIEEDTVINGLQFSVIDTAGIRDDAADRVEAAGIERSRELAASADVVLVVADITDAQSAGTLLTALSRATHGVVGVVLTRDDKAPEVRTPTWVSDLPMTRVNLLDADSRGALERLLVALAQSAGVRFDEDHVLIARARHRDLLVDARDRLVAATQAAYDDVGHEFVALDLREALDALGSMTGAITSEDILHRIFSDFCVGK